MKTSTFAAMGTEICVITSAGTTAAHEALTSAVLATFREAERCFSRFSEDSELSRLNRTRGLAVVSPLLFEGLARAKQHGEATQGLVDPTVGSDLVAAGYARSFAPGALDRPEPAPPPRAHATFRELWLEPVTRTVLCPPEVLLDLGGLVKGWTADRAAQLLPATSVLDAGGDVVLRGQGEDGEGWLVEIEDPFDRGAVLRTLRVSEGAAATSGITRRRWIAGETEHHHLIDPRTGRPSRSDLAQVTVLAASAEEAEVMAKTALLLGARAGRRWLEARPGIRALLVHRDRRVEVVGALDFVDDEVAA